MYVPTVHPISVVYVVQWCVVLPPQNICPLPFYHYECNVRKWKMVTCPGSPSEIDRDYGFEPKSPLPRGQYSLCYTTLMLMN